MTNLFLLLAVLLGLIVGLAAASVVDCLKLKAAYRLGYHRGDFNGRKRAVRISRSRPDEMK